MTNEYFFIIAFTAGGICGVSPAGARIEQTNDIHNYMYAHAPIEATEATITYETVKLKATKEDVERAADNAACDPIVYYRDIKRKMSEWSHDMVYLYYELKKLLINKTA